MDDLDLFTELLGELNDRLVGQRLGQRLHLTERHQLLHDLGDTDVQVFGDVLDGRAGIDPNGIRLSKRGAGGTGFGLFVVHATAPTAAALAARRLIGLRRATRPGRPAGRLRVDDDTAAATGGAGGTLALKRITGRALVRTVTAAAVGVRGLPAGRAAVALSLGGCRGWLVLLGARLALAGLASLVGLVAVALAALATGLTAALATALAAALATALAAALVTVALGLLAAAVALILVTPRLCCLAGAEASDGAAALPPPSPAGEPPFPSTRAAVASSTLEEADLTLTPAALSFSITSLVGSPRSLAIS